MIDASEIPDLVLPADFEQRCSAVCLRLRAGEPMTVEYIAGQLGVPYEFIATALAVLFRAIAHSVPALVDISPDRPLH